MKFNSISLTNTPYVWPDSCPRLMLLPRTTCLIPPVRTIHRYFVRACDESKSHSIDPLRVACTVRGPAFPLRCGPLCRICGDECKLQGMVSARKMPATGTRVATRDGKAAAADLNEPDTKAESSGNDSRPFWYCDNNHSFWFACHNDMYGVLPENPRCYCLFTTRLVQDGKRFYYRCASAGCGYIIDYPVDIWPPPAMTLEKGKEKLELISDDGGDDYFEDILGVVSCTSENGERIFQRAKDGPRLRAHSFGRQDRRILD